MASSVQYVDRTDLILVNSERSAPPSVTLPALAGSAVSDRGASSVAVVAISDSTSGQDRRVAAAGHTGVELDTGGGQIHERLLKRGVYRRQLVQPHRVLISQVANLTDGQ